MGGRLSANIFFLRDNFPLCKLFAYPSILGQGKERNTFSPTSSYYYNYYNCTTTQKWSQVTSHCRSKESNPYLLFPPSCCCSMEASESAFIHLVMSSLVSAAKWNVLMLWCSALKACLRWTPSSRGQAGLILYEGRRTEPRIFSSSGPAEKRLCYANGGKICSFFISCSCHKDVSAVTPGASFLSRRLFYSPFPF